MVMKIVKEFEKVFSFSHPNIVKVDELHLDFQHGYVYCVMEYVKGTTLSHCLESQKRLSGPLIGKYFSELVDAMAYLLKKRVVHRDLSPYNVVIAKKDAFDPISHVKLIDFNVAKFFEEDEEMLSNPKNRFKYSMMTQTGTVQYRAPEIFKGGNYTEAADIWSLGCLLYRMVEGKDPIECE